MGRPLKIKKSTTIDIGFNDFGNLEVPVVPVGLTTTEFLGVVGGGNVGIATDDYPVVKITANVNGQQGAAYIITQKGTTKYLVSGENSVNAGSFTPGFSYQILTLGNTDFTAIGAGINPTVGQVFTATGAGSGSGTASDAGQCQLIANATINSGEMNMIFSANGGSVYASRLTNKYIYDSAGGRFAVNFFVAGDTNAATINNVAVANTAGWFTANATTFTTGQIVNVSGTLTGNATITGYVDPTTYYVIDTNGTTTFQLAASEGAANIVTVAGNTRGLTFSDVVSTTVKSGAEGVTFSNGTGNLTLAQVQNYTS
jgi:phage-related protein